MLYADELRADTLAERILTQSAGGFSAFATCRRADSLSQYRCGQTRTHKSVHTDVNAGFDSSTTGD